MNAPHVVSITDPATGASARILVSLGFNCFSWRPALRDGPREMLWAHQDFASGNERPSLSGVPLLFPFPGRIGKARFMFGGREYFLVVASPEPVAELEAELSRLPAPTPGKPITYAKVGDGTIELLRGVGGVSEVPSGTAAPAPRSRAFDRFRALAARETEVSGVWVRQIVLENPGR